MKRLLPILLVGLILLLAIPLTSCAEKPAERYVLKPSDVGPLWSYKVTTHGLSYGGNPQFWQGGREATLNINLVVLKNSQSILEGIWQSVVIFAQTEGAIDDIERATSFNLVDIPGWDEAYLDANSGDAVILYLRKDNIRITLNYTEVLIGENPVTGEPYVSGGWLPLTQETIEGVSDLLCSLAEKILSRSAPL
ncbi:hypothetical protein ES708_21521 [subsurface metagenome]